MKKETTKKETIKSVPLSKEANVIKMKKLLKSNDYLIFSGEYDRRKRNVVVAYILFFLFGGFGIHQFYFNGKRGGIILGSLIVFIISAVSGLFILEIFALFTLLGLELWDLFDIPSQVRENNINAEFDILSQLTSK